jgi:uroporphyrinogen decarboxylase
MGNVAPLDILLNGDPEQVAAHAQACIKTHPNHVGLILSAGGGVSPDTPAENIQALATTTQAN